MNIEIDGADSEYQVSDGDNFDSDSPESEDDFEDNDIAKNSIRPIHPFCTLCNKPINKGQKELHILSEHFILHVECKICKETTGNNNSDRETINHLIPLDNYFDHLTTSHQENLNCHSCKSKYMLKNDTYRNHFLKKHLKDILCRCIECEKQNGINSSSTHINKDNLVKAHSVKGHLQGMHTPEGQGRFPCNICGLLLTKKSLPRHIKNLHTDKTLDDNNLCDICGKYFSQLKRHKRIHIPLNERIKDKNYLCKTCGKAFSNAYNLRVHSRLHTGEKPYVCDVCGKGFCQNVELRLHTKNHHDKTKTRSKKQKKKENRPVSVNSTSGGHILQNIRFVEENTVTTEDPNQTISQIPAENHVLEMHPQHGAEIHQEPLYAVLTTSYSGSSEAILCANNIQEQTFLQVTNTVETNTNDRDW
uniref:zinc finger protein 658B-like isoform X1 n=1 Tax=Styela clava TaxID=7725 RepID=UPI00193AA3A3|nr:zinc finger protein 658B-like isoform X1 [Styela clava]